MPLPEAICYRKPPILTERLWGNPNTRYCLAALELVAVHQPNDLANYGRIVAGGRNLVV